MNEIIDAVTGRSKAQKGTNQAAHVVTIPLDAQSKTIVVACTSTASTSAALPNQGSVMRVVNEGPNNAYVAVTENMISAVATLPTTTATTTCLPIMAGEDVSFSIPNYEVFNVSGICRASGTCNLIISVGEGT